MSFFPQVSLLRQVGQGGRLGGGASVPGRVPRIAQRSVDPAEYSPNLASAVSFRTFSYCGERQPSGAVRPLLASCPLPPQPGSRGEEERYPGEGWRSQGCATVGCWARHSRQSPVPEAPSAPGYTAASASQRTGGEGLRQPDWPTSPSMLGASHMVSHTACEDGLRALRPRPESDLPVPIPNPTLPRPPRRPSALNNLGKRADLRQDPVGTVQITTEPEPLHGRRQAVRPEGGLRCGWLGVSHLSSSGTPALCPR